MKLRIGRKNKRTLYLQRGEEPSSQDSCVGFAADWHTAVALCALVNGAGGDPWGHLDEMARIANWIDPSSAIIDHPV